MKRCFDWAARLELYLDANARRGFEAPEWDCAAFVLGAIEVMTGRVIARPASVEAGIEALGLLECGVLSAQRGDLLLTKGGVLGLMALDGKTALLVGDGGIQAAPLRLIVRAWRV